MGWRELAGMPAHRTRIRDTTTYSRPVNVVCLHAFMKWDGRTLKQRAIEYGAAIRSGVPTPESCCLHVMRACGR